MKTWLRQAGSHAQRLRCQRVAPEPRAAAAPSEWSHIPPMRSAKAHTGVLPSLLSDSYCTQPHLLLLELLAKLFCSLPSFFQFHIWFFEKLLLLLCFCQQVHSSYNHFLLQCGQFLQQGLVLLSRETGKCKLPVPQCSQGSRSSSVLQPRQHSQGWKNLSCWHRFKRGWGSASVCREFPELQLSSLPPLTWFCLWQVSLLHLPSARGWGHQRCHGCPGPGCTAVPRGSCRNRREASEQRSRRLRCKAGTLADAGAVWQQDWPVCSGQRNLGSFWAPEWRSPTPKVTCCDSGLWKSWLAALMLPTEQAVLLLFTGPHGLDHSFMFLCYRRNKWQKDKVCLFHVL